MDSIFYTSIMFGIPIWIIYSIFTWINNLKKDREKWEYLHAKILDDNQELKKENEILLHDNQKLKYDLKKHLTIYDNALKDIRAESVLFPSITNAMNIVQQVKDEFVSDFYKFKKRPALKTAEAVSKAKKEAREKNKELQEAINRVNLYESLAPWLIEYTELTLDELLKGLKEEKALKKSHNKDEDAVALYVSKSEWATLDVDTRNQLALDRYSNPKRKKSLWQVGIDYERYVGFSFERLGYRVKYHGALKGKEDLGIDLICTTDDFTVVVQCKRLSSIKQIPVRENTVAQTYGASNFYAMSEGIEKVGAVIVTSYELSEKAREFANYLGVTFKENMILQTYPMIKCNISKTTGEKIYHLPMDQQYDNINMSDNKGSFYALTVKEAVSKGFRRAYKWRSK